MVYQGSSLSDRVDALYDCAYSGSVEIEWDAKKAASNLRKHGIDFADAALVFEDDLALPGQTCAPSTRSASSPWNAIPKAGSWSWATPGEGSAFA